MSTRYITFFWGNDAHESLASDRVRSKLSSTLNLFVLCLFSSGLVHHTTLFVSFFRLLIPDLGSIDKYHTSLSSTLILFGRLRVNVLWYNIEFCWTSTLQKQSIFWAMGVGKDGHPE